MSSTAMTGRHDLDEADKKLGEIVAAVVKNGARPGDAALAQLSLLLAISDRLGELLRRTDPPRVPDWERPIATPADSEEHS